MTNTPFVGANASDPTIIRAESSVAPPGGWTNPRRGYLFFLGFAAIGAGMGDLVPAVLTLSIKSAIIDPGHATTVLSIVVAIASLFSLIAFPLLGRVSDRTVGGLGRRRPFLLLGAVLFAVGGVLIVAATSTALLTLAFSVTAVGFSSTMVAVTATIADQFEPNRRGPASAIVGLSLPLGALVGLFIAQLVAPNLALMVLLPAALAAIGSVLFSVTLRDRRLTAAERAHFGWVEFCSTFWVNPVKNRSFALAWWSRLLLFFGVAAVQAYQAFYLIIVLHFTPASVANAVFLSTLVLVVLALIFAPIAGKVSDRVGRRKPFVIAAAVIFAVGLVLASQAHSFGAFLIAIGVVGIGQGVYFAVDIALITQILPDPNNPAKDLGIMNLASTLPSSIVPAVAPALLAIGASATLPQNFMALFITGAFAALVGAVFILPIRKVR